VEDAASFFSGQTILPGCATIGDRGVVTLDGSAIISGTGRCEPCEAWLRAGPHAGAKTDGAADRICAFAETRHAQSIDHRFRLLPSFARQGYARKLGRPRYAWPGPAWHQSASWPSRIPTNTASIRLLEKLGFKFDGSSLAPDKPELKLFGDVLRRRSYFLRAWGGTPRAERGARRLLRQVHHSVHPPTWE